MMKLNKVLCSFLILSLLFESTARPSIEFFAALAEAVLIGKSLGPSSQNPEPQNNTTSEPPIDLDDSAYLTHEADLLWPQIVAFIDQHTNLADKTLSKNISLSHTGPVCSLANTVCRILPQKTTGLLSSAKGVDNASTMRAFFAIILSLAASLGLSAAAPESMITHITSLPIFYLALATAGLITIKSRVDSQHGDAFWNRLRLRGLKVPTLNPWLWFEKFIANDFYEAYLLQSPDNLIKEMNAYASRLKLRADILARDSKYAPEEGFLRSFIEDRILKTIPMTINRTANRMQKTYESFTAARTEIVDFVLKHKLSDVVDLDGLKYSFTRPSQNHSVALDQFFDPLLDPILSNVQRNDTLSHYAMTLAELDHKGSALLDLSEWIEKENLHSQINLKFNFTPIDQVKKGRSVGIWKVTMAIVVRGTSLSVIEVETRFNTKYKKLADVIKHKEWKEPFLKELNQVLERHPDIFALKLRHSPEAPLGKCVDALTNKPLDLPFLLHDEEEELPSWQSPSNLELE